MQEALKPQPPADLIISLQGSKRRVFVSTAQWLFFTAVVTVGMFVNMPREELWGALVLLLSAVLMIGLLGVVLPLFLSRHRPAMRIHISQEGLSLPQMGGSPPIFVPYRKLQSLVLRPDFHGFLWIGSEAGNFVYAMANFASSEHPKLAIQRIREHIAWYADGAHKLEVIDRASQTANTAHSRPIRASLSLMGVVLAFYLLQSLLGYNNLNPFRFADLGAALPELVWAHQFWRIVIAPWLLGMAPILLLQVLAAIFYFGRPLEQLIGPGRVIAIFIGSGIFGVLTALIFGQEPMSFGGTAGGAGLIGASVYLSQRQRQDLPLGFDNSPMVWVLAILFIVIGPAVMPYADLSLELDMAYQLGGFLGGVLLLAFLLPDLAPFPREEAVPSRRVVVSLAVCFGLLVLSAGAWARHLQVTPPETDFVRMFQIYLDRNLGSSYELNNLAWRAATDPEVTPERLRLAKVAAERAVEREEHAADETLAGVEDTLATVQFRMGETEAAIQTELQALTRAPSELLASQLARFLEKRESPKLEPLEAAFVLDAKLGHHEPRGFFLSFEKAAPLETAVTAYGLIEAQGEIQGLLRFSLKPGEDLSRPIWLEREGTRPSWPSESTIRVLWVDAGKLPWIGWGMLPSIRSLP